MSGFLDGIFAYFQAFRIISEMRLWKYMLIPGIISLLLGAGIAASAYAFSDDLADWLIHWYPFETGLNALMPIAWIIAIVLIVTSGLIIYKHTVMVLASPFMTPLAQKVEDNLLGVSNPFYGFSFRQAAKDIFRGLHIALRNIIRELLFVFLFLPVNLIPGLGSFLSGLGVFLVQSYYAGFGNMDYSLERHMDVYERVEFVREHRGLAIGNGAVFMIFLFTAVGFIFAPPLATVAATIETTKRLYPDETVWEV